MSSTRTFAISPVTRVGQDDIARMRAGLFFDGPDRAAKLSKFWVLLVLAAAIASAGVVGDSTATVIGAMIVAPLMTPIMGVVVAAALGDRSNLIRSVLMVLGGACAAIGVGYLFGLVMQVDVVAATSSQVAGRIHPRLIDLYAAIATGAVGAFAQCRSDVSDALPGVAIAISLVPPLTVVGLTLESGAPTESMGALLLFGTNVAAIWFTGAVVMALFRVHEQSGVQAGGAKRAIALTAGLLVLLALPLGAGSLSALRSNGRISAVEAAAHDFVDGTDWAVVTVREPTGSTNDISTDDGTNPDIELVLSGPEPAPSTDTLTKALKAHGVGDLSVSVRMIPETRVVLGG